MRGFVTLVLASASPRRSEILKLLGVPFETEAPQIEEECCDPDSREWPRLLAREKALDVSCRKKDRWVIGFDTLVFLEEKPLGKPKTPDEAFEMLSQLSGCFHEVVTGVALTRNGKVFCEGAEKTKVLFRELGREEILDYINTSEPMDKAGAYGIQGKGARLVRSLEGCFYNVVGLPVALTLDYLKKMKDCL